MLAARLHVEAKFPEPRARVPERGAVAAVCRGNQREEAALPGTGVRKRLHLHLRARERHASAVGERKVELHAVTPLLEREGEPIAEPGVRLFLLALPIPVHGALVVISLESEARVPHRDRNHRADAEQARPEQERRQRRPEKPARAWRAVRNCTGYRRLSRHQAHGTSSGPTSRYGVSAVKPWSSATRTTISRRPAWNEFVGATTNSAVVRCAPPATSSGFSGAINVTGGDARISSR